LAIAFRGSVMLDAIALFHGAQERTADRVNHSATYTQVRAHRAPLETKGNIGTIPHPMAGYGKTHPRYMMTSLQSISAASSPMLARAPWRRYSRCRRCE
jgi:hypothetical protein